MSDDVLNLIPLASSVGVQVHPHSDGDVVSEMFVDRASGRRIMIWRTPSAACKLGRDLVMATTDPYISAAADGVRKVQQ